jgi:hypothetical protein
MKRILSIDWDYFVDVNDKERTLLFPDGGTEFISGTLSDMIWGMRYLDSIRFNEKSPNEFRKLTDIPIKPEYKKLRKVIRDQDSSVPVMVVDSHSHIVQFLEDVYPDETDFEIYNIDFHHDIYGTSRGEDINCGNWLRILIESGKVSKVVWVRDKDSDMYEKDKSLGVEDVLDFDVLVGLGFEVIYLCRSCVWSPPHLDKWFISIFNLLKDRFFLVKYEEGMTRSRFKKIETYVRGQGQRELLHMRAMFDSDE